VVTSTIVVNIVDDVPKANADTASVTEGGVVTGNVLANDVGGADGPAAGGGVVGVRAGSDTSTPVVGGLNSQINGTYGYLTLDAHGNAEYHSYPNSVNGPGATDTFTYTLRDGDGDQSTTTLTIDVNNSCIKAVSDNDVTVYEKALDDTKDGQDLAAGYATGSDPHNAGETASGTGRFGHRRHRCDQLQPGRQCPGPFRGDPAQLRWHLHLHPDDTGEHHAARERRRQHRHRNLHLPGHRFPGRGHQHHRGQHRR
jgi:VCBS repeat-containing protein